MNERLTQRFLDPVVSDEVAAEVRAASRRAEETGLLQTVDLPVEDGFATTPDGRMIACSSQVLRWPIAPDIRIVDQRSPTAIGSRIGSHSPPFVREPPVLWLQRSRVRSP